MRALLDTLPASADDAERAAFEDKRLYGAMLIAAALSDLALIRSVFLKYPHE